MPKSSPKKEDSRFSKVFWEFGKEPSPVVWTFVIGFVIGGFLIGSIWFFSRSQSESTQPHEEYKFSGNSYDVIYSGKTRTPTWVEQILDSEIIKPLEEKRYSFQSNPQLPQNVRAELSDYQGSGFEIGLLLTPTTIDDIQKILYLSNTAPQDPKFKKGYWQKLTQHVLDLTKDYKVLVISGPLNLGEDTSNGKQFIKYQVIGENKIAVPTHFFKVVYTSENDKPEIYIVPNKEIDMKTPLQFFQVKPDEFEKISGIILPKNVAPYFAPTPRPMP